jgi:hypothetical protein
MLQLIIGLIERRVIDLDSALGAALRTGATRAAGSSRNRSTDRTNRISMSFWLQSGLICSGEYRRVAYRAFSRFWLGLSRVQLRTGAVERGEMCRS